MQHIMELEIDPIQETFTHIAGDGDGKTRTFLIGTMINFISIAGPKCRDLEFILAPIDKKLADYMRSNHGVEDDRLERLDDPYLSAPIIGIRWPDDEVTIIDGAHRVVKNVWQGKSQIKMVIFKYPFWEQFLLPDHVAEKLVADGIMKRRSGVLEHEKSGKIGA